LRIRFLSLLITLLVISPLVISVGGEIDVSVRVLPNMPRPRYNHTSVRTGERIYVFGGTADGTTSLAISEALDPKANEWTELPNMSIPRMRHTASYMEALGRIIIVGGFQGGGHPSLFRHFMGDGNISLSSCEFFDVETERFTEAPSLETGRFWHNTHLLPNGSLLVMGGLNVTSGTLSSCELFDGKGWRVFPSLPIPLARFASCVYPDGSILVAGGHNGTVKVGSRRAFLFEPSRGEWREVSPMNRGRGYPGFCYLPGHGFLVSGGFSMPGMDDHTSAEIYIRETDKWVMTGNMSFPRHAHGSVVTADGRVMVAGGSNCETGMCHSGMEIYDPVKNEWENIGSFIVARKWGTVTSTPDGDAVVIGGRACNYATGRSELVLFSDVSSVETDTFLRDLCLGTMFLSIFLILPAALVWKMRRLEGFD